MQKEHTRELDIDGYKYVVSGLLHSECNSCNEWITTPEQSRHNKRLIVEARANAVAARDDSQRLTPSTILSIRKKLRLTQVQAARIFGGGLNAFSKYENCEVTPSEGMDRLLRLANEVPEAASWLLRRGGVPLPVTKSEIDTRLVRNITQHIFDLDLEIKQEYSEISKLFYLLTAEKFSVPSPGLAREVRGDFTYHAANDSDNEGQYDQLAVG